MRRVRRTLAFAIAMLPTAGSFSCVVCDEPDVCARELWIQIGEPDLAPLLPGTWTFTFVLDERDTITAACDVGLGALSATCEGDVEILPLAAGPVGSAYVGLHLVCAPGFGVDEAPETLDIRIERGEVILHEQTHTPLYERATSRHCASECESASLDITVDGG